MSEIPGQSDPLDHEIIAEIYCHIVFWTRDFAPTLTRETLAAAAETMDQAMFTVDGEALVVGGAENHLHVLARLSPSRSLQETLGALRRYSEARIAGVCGIPDFSWSHSELAVTISPEDLDRARRFVQDQQSYHDLVPFEAELRDLFDEHGFDYDGK